MGEYRARVALSCAMVLRVALYISIRSYYSTCSGVVLRIPNETLGPLLLGVNLLEISVLFRRTRTSDKFLYLLESCTCLPLQVGLFYT